MHRKTEILMKPLCVKQHNTVNSVFFLDKQPKNENFSYPETKNHKKHEKVFGILLHFTWKKMTVSKLTNVFEL